MVDSQSLHRGKDRFNMKPYQQRVVDEKDELDARIAALGTFVFGETFVNLDEPEQDRIHRQQVVMCDYSLILGKRIGAFV